MTRLAVYLTMTLWCQYAYDVVWPEMLEGAQVVQGGYSDPAPEWPSAVKALCLPLRRPEPVATDDTIDWPVNPLTNPWTHGEWSIR